MEDNPIRDIQKAMEDIRMSTGLIVYRRPGGYYEGETEKMFKRVKSSKDIYPLNTQYYKEGEE